MSARVITELFTSKAADYDHGRPGYPASLVDWLELAVDARFGQRVADVGCGTGLLAERFIAHGYQVVGIEPDSAMGDVAVGRLGNLPSFTLRTGVAEATGLPDGDVDGIAVGTAFHWFEPRSTADEFRRILRPNGWVALVGNERIEISETDHAFSKLLARFRGNAHKSMRPLAACEPEKFLGSNTKHERFHYEFKMSESSFKSLAFSRSYFPESNSPQRKLAEVAVAETFCHHAVEGVLVLNYEVTAFAAQPFDSHA